MAKKKKKKVSKKKTKKKKKTKLKKRPPKVKPGQTCPATPVLWHEDLKFPFCDYCLSGRKCYCGAEEEKGSCDYCEEGCTCGYEQYKEGYYCHCKCTCEPEDDEDDEDRDGNCGICCTCSYQLKDELPNDQCYCECSCPRCTCYCRCGELIIDADSYNQWVKDTCLVCDPECLSDQHLNISDVIPEIKIRSLRRCIIPIGDYEFSVVTLPLATSKMEPRLGFRSMVYAQMGMPQMLMDPEDFEEVTDIKRVAIIQGNCKGTVRFSGPVHTPVLGKFDQEGKLRTWMSLTPMEVMSQMPGVEKAFGNVLIGGLGMGWLTRRVLEKPEVDSVTQIEFDLDILRFFGIPLEEMFPDKLSLIADDFWSFLNDYDVSLFDTILVDIWPKYRDARRDPLFKALRKSHPNVWGWGEQRIINRYKERY